MCRFFVYIQTTVGALYFPVDERIIDIFRLILTCTISKTIKKAVLCALWYRLSKTAANTRFSFIDEQIAAQLVIFNIFYAEKAQK